MANAFVALAEAAEMMDETWDLRPVWHGNRFGSTAPLITRYERAHGDKFHTVHVVKPYSGSRSTNSLESAMPESTKIETEQVYVDCSNSGDMRRTGSSIGYTLPASMQLPGDEHSCWKIAAELSRQVAKDQLEKKDHMIQLDEQGAKSVVGETSKTEDVYTATGSAVYASGSTCFIPISVPSLYRKGELVDIRSGAAATDDATTVYRLRAEVMDVIYADDLFGNAVGPGVVLVFVADGDAGATDTDFSNVAAADEIAASEEGTLYTPNYPGSFGTLIDLGASPAAYFSVTRTTAGEHHWIPFGKTYSASTPLDLDTHFGTMFNTMTRFIPLNRQLLDRNSIEWTKAIVCQAQPDLIQEASKLAGDSSRRFTRHLSSDFKDAQAKLVAIAGWDGVVIHTPGLPPIAMMAEALMPVGKIRIWDPNHWRFIHMGPKRPTWLEDGGGRWHLNRVSQGSGNDAKLSPKMIAGCFTIDTAFCDNAQTLYQMENLIDSI